MPSRRAFSCAMLALLFDQRALRMTRNPADAGYLLQETTAESLCRLPLVPEGTPPQAWRYRILTST